MTRVRETTDSPHVNTDEVVAQIIAAPLRQLLEEHNAQIVDITSVKDPRFFGWLVEKTDGRVILAMPAGRDAAERDCTIRMLLTHRLDLPLGQFPRPFAVTDVVQDGVDVL